MENAYYFKKKLHGFKNFGIKINLIFNSSLHKLSEVPPYLFARWKKEMSEKFRQLSGHWKQLLVSREWFLEMKGREGAVPIPTKLNHGK